MDNIDNQNEITTSEPLLKSTMLAAALSVVLVVILTVWGEFSSALKDDFLKGTFGHHWVGKGVLAVALFAVATLAMHPMFKKRNINAKTTLVILNTALILGSLILFFFFVYEYFHKYVT